MRLSFRSPVFRPSPWIKSFALAAVVALLMGGPGRAELSPQAYRHSQTTASEQVDIEVTQSDVAEQPDKSRMVSLRAKVNQVIRTGNNVKAGDTLIIHYTVPSPRPAGFVGPAPVPVLEVGWKGPAFLNREDKENLYTPAARSFSFRPLVEALRPQAEAMPSTNSTAPAEMPSQPGSPGDKAKPAQPREPATPAATPPPAAASR